MKNKKNILFSIMFIFFLSTLIMLRQLNSPHYFAVLFEDSYTYTSWSWQFIEAIREGVIYPRWLPFEFWGYGSPAFILYPPLAFYLVAFFNIFTGSVIAAMNITKFTALFFSATGMFFFVKEFYSEKIALLSSIFYAIFPYIIFQFYFAGGFASNISYIWFSPILLFIYKYVSAKQLKHIIYAGLCYGGLILTHLINAYMFSFIIIAFVIYLSFTKKNLRGLLTIPAIIMIGILISAAYVFPFAYEKQFLKLNYLIKKGGGISFDFHNYFILPKMADKFPYNHFWNVYYSTFLIFTILFGILIIFAFIQILKLKHIKKSANIQNDINIFFLGIAIITLFLLFGVSTFIWESLPFFEYIQFPMRWLNIATFAVVFLSSAIFSTLKQTSKSKRGQIFLLVSLYLTCLLLDYRYISSAIVFDQQHLPTHKGTNWNLEHLPTGVNIEKIDRNDSEKKIVIMRGEGEIKNITWMSTERNIEISAENQLTVKIYTFNFPGWNAYIDGTLAKLKTVEGEGTMLIDIPKGKHTLSLSFSDTPIRYYSKFISLGSFLVFLLLVLFSQRPASLKPFVR